MPMGKRGVAVAGPSSGRRRCLNPCPGPFPASPSIIPDSEISPVRLEAKTSPQCGLPEPAGSLSGNAHSPPTRSVYPTGRWSLWSCKPRTPLSGALASQAHPQPVFAQGSFTPEALPLLPRYYKPMRQSRCLPPPLRRSTPYRRCPCRWRHPRLVIVTFPTFLCPSVLKCRAPYAGGSSGAPDQFFPDVIGLHPP